jgi:hypothetical protein
MAWTSETTSCLRESMAQEPNSERQGVNRGRHEKLCAICKHPRREEIEQDFVNWRSPAEIARTYKLSDRSTVYRHAHALKLFGKRQRNIRAALERIIEKACDVEVTAASVVAAVQAYAKINAAGQWVDRSETINLHELFERMTQDELEAYARDGKLPAWFSQTVNATPSGSQELPSD